VTFCELPEGYVTAAPVERWDDVPPASEGYANARDAMVEHIHRFLNRLEAEDRPTPGQDEPRRYGARRLKVCWFARACGIGRLDCITLCAA